MPKLATRYISRAGDVQPEKLIITRAIGTACGTTKAHQIPTANGSAPTVLLRDTKHPKERQGARHTATIESHAQTRQWRSRPGSF